MQGNMLVSIAEAWQEHAQVAFEISKNSAHKQCQKVAKWCFLHR